MEDPQRARAVVHVDRGEPLADRGHDPARPHAGHRPGPETKATVTAIPTEAEFFGIVFSLGLTRRTIRQIARAENAVEALGRGLSSPDAALQLGYADQAHLIRSLKRFIGQTPAQVVNHGGHWSAGSPVEPRSSRDG